MTSSDILKSIFFNSPNPPYIYIKYNIRPYWSYTVVCLVRSCGNRLGCCKSADHQYEKQDNDENTNEKTTDDLFIVIRRMFTILFVFSVSDQCRFRKFEFIYHVVF